MLECLCIRDSAWGLHVVRVSLTLRLVWRISQPLTHQLSKKKKPYYTHTLEFIELRLKEDTLEIPYNKAAGENNLCKHQSWMNFGFVFH